jgi:hypothetical protein
MTRLMSVSDEMCEPADGQCFVGIGSRVISQDTTAEFHGLSDVQVRCVEG